MPLPNFNASLSSSSSFFFCFFFYCLQFENEPLPLCDILSADCSKETIDPTEIFTLLRELRGKNLNGIFVCFIYIEREQN